MNIPDHVIESIKNRIPPLKMAGILGLAVTKKFIICPYHPDTSPSMSCSHPFVFNCFACQAKRDVLRFYAEQRGLTFPESVRELAPHAGIEYDFDLPKKTRSRDERTKVKYFLSLDAARRYYGSWSFFNFEKEHLWFNEDFTLNKVAFRLQPKNEGDRKQIPTIFLRGGRWQNKKPDNHPLPLPYKWIESMESQEIVLVEGESDADAGHTIGMAAVTTGGSGSWDDSYGRFFADKDAIVIPDNDAAGRKYAADAVAIIKPLCRSLKVVNLGGPEKSDLRDYINGGGSLRSLRMLIDAAEDIKIQWQPPLMAWDGFERIPSFDPEEMLPEYLRHWLLHLAADLQCPIDALAVAAITGLSTLIGAKVGLKPKRHSDWIEYANLWYLLVAPPGDKKTAILRAGLRPVFKLDEELSEANRAASAELQADLAILEAERKHVLAKISELLKADAVAAHWKTRLASINQKIDDLNLQGERCLVMHDVTPEKAKSILIANPLGVMQFNDEFGGWWRNLDKGAHSDARSVYLEAWGGGTVKVQRMKGVSAGWSILSFVSSTQPDWIKSIIKQITAGTDENDGMLARFGLIINHDRPIGSFVWRDEPVVPQARELFEGLFRAMWELKTEDITGSVNNRAMTFSPDAQVFFADWLSAHENSHRDSEANSALTSHLMKQSRLFCSLSIIFHLIFCIENEKLTPEVSLPAVELSAKWCRYVAMHIRKTYDPKNGYWKPCIRSFASHVLAGNIKDGMSRTEMLGRRFQHLKSAKELDSVISELSELQLLKQMEDYSDGRSRPKKIIRLNPLPFEITQQKNAVAE